MNAFWRVLISIVTLENCIEAWGSKKISTTNMIRQTACIAKSLEEFRKVENGGSRSIASIVDELWQKSIGLKD